MHTLFGAFLPRTAGRRRVLRFDPDYYNCMCVRHTFRSRRQAHAIVGTTHASERDRRFRQPARAPSSVSPPPPLFAWRARTAGKYGRARGNAVGRRRQRRVAVRRAGERRRRGGQMIAREGDLEWRSGSSERKTRRRRRREKERHREKGRVLWERAPFTRPSLPPDTHAAADRHRRHSSTSSSPSYNKISFSTFPPRRKHTPPPAASLILSPSLTLSLSSSLFFLSRPPLYRPIAPSLVFISIRARDH